MFSVDVPGGGGISSFLPPSPDKPWRLDVTEGGFLNRSGRVTAWQFFVSHRADIFSATREHLSLGLSFRRFCR